MVFILQNIYVAYALSHDALPAEIDIDAEHFDVVVAGAEWIASDLKKILSDERWMYRIVAITHYSVEPWLV